MSDTPFSNSKPWLASSSDTNPDECLSEQQAFTMCNSEAYLCRELYMAHDLIGKLNYVSNILKGMYVTEPLKDLHNLVVGESSRISVLAKDHLTIIENALNDANSDSIL